MVRKINFFYDIKWKVMKQLSYPHKRSYNKQPSKMTHQSLSQKKKDTKLLLIKMVDKDIKK